MMHIMIFIGTRPEITKCAPIIRRIVKDKQKLTLIHSGQHYDYEMSKIFLKELDLPKLTTNLEIGSGTHGEQTGRMIIEYEKEILKYKPDIILAQGDTNSVVAASIVCSKLNIPFGHIEAGIRSHDFTMPEEINRKVADSVSALYFAPTEVAVLNLLYEGIDPRRVFLTGNTAVDAIIEHSKIAIEKSKIIEELKLPKDKKTITLTAHRAANVDNKEGLEAICDSLIALNKYSIVFSIHPRTKKKLVEFNLLEKLEKESHIFLIDPLGYLDFLSLMQNSVLIITDSGGLQEEAISLQKPCITLRNNTERPETVKLGVNRLVGTDTAKIIDAVNYFTKNKDIQHKLTTLINPYGDGKASEKILKIIKEKHASNSLIFLEPKIHTKGSYEFKLIRLETERTIEAIEKEYKGIVTLVYDDQGSPQIIRKKIPSNWFVRIQF